MAAESLKNEGGCHNPFAHRTHKPRGRVSDQQRRRELALERQRSARRDLQNHARRLAFQETGTGEMQGSPNLENHNMQEELRTESTDFTVLPLGPNISELTISELSGEGKWRRINKDGEPIDDNSEAQPSGAGQSEDWGGQAEQTECDMAESGQAAIPEDWYAQQLMQPEWMADIPPNLATDWYVMARPEGKRCLVVSANSSTISRSRNGRILHRFPSCLPNGSRAHHAAPHMYCILDCIFHEPDQTYYVIDMMCWRGYALYDCAAEFRFYWVHSKLAETDGVAQVSHYNRFRFVPVPVYNCTREGLWTAYAEPTPYERDGLLLFNRHSHYSLGLTPLVLLWKDERCSRYVLDTDAQGNVPPTQQLVLRVQADGVSAATCDDPPVTIATVPAQLLQETSPTKRLRPGSLLRFGIYEGGLTVVDGRVQGGDLRYEGPANQRRGAADSYSKILFQYMARRNPLTMSDFETAMTPSDQGGDTQMACDMSETS